MKCNVNGCDNDSTMFLYLNTLKIVFKLCKYCYNNGIMYNVKSFVTAKILTEDQYKKLSSLNDI